MEGGTRCDELPVSPNTSTSLAIDKTIPGGVGDIDIFKRIGGLVILRVIGRYNYK